MLASESGGLLIDKPEGWTSHDVVAVVRKRLGTRAVGHAGTLDPFATGLLVVLFGQATRLARFIEGEVKRYRATVRFGVATDTEDGTGTPVQVRQPAEWPSRHDIDALVNGFVGTQRQRPPVFSAKHVAGTRSYRLARDGIAVDLPPVEVQVHALDVVDWTPPDLVIDATVGRGTYLRALARDLGERIDIPAHCARLRRTGVGRFDVEAAVTPDGIDGAPRLTMAQLVSHLPSEQLDAAAVREVSHGRTIAQQAPVEGWGALCDEAGALVAVGEGRDGRWLPSVVLVPAQ